MKVSVITSFYLAPEDGELPSFKPGQYITLQVPSPCGHPTMRNYSLSDKSGNDWFRISVKREVGKESKTPAGYVSNLLHDNIDVGDNIQVAPPCGEFFLDLTEKHERTLVLLSAGVGITPILSILLSVIEETPDRPIFFIHGSLNKEAQAFKQTIDTLASTHSNLKVHYRYQQPCW